MGFDGCFPSVQYFTPILLQRVKPEGFYGTGLFVANTDRFLCIVFELVMLGSNIEMFAMSIDWPCAIQNDKTQEVSRAEQVHANGDFESADIVSTDALPQKDTMVILAFNAYFTDRTMSHKFTSSYFTDFAFFFVCPSILFIVILSAIVSAILIWWFLPILVKDLRRYPWVAKKCIEETCVTKNNENIIEQLPFPETYDLHIH